MRDDININFHLLKHLVVHHVVGKPLLVGQEHLDTILGPCPAQTNIQHPVSKYGAVYVQPHS